MVTFLRKLWLLLLISLQSQLVQNLAFSRTDNTALATRYPDFVGELRLKGMVVDKKTAP